jgi:hypothetical protein
VSQARREKRFVEAVRASGLVPEADLDKALNFQKFAHARGKPLPLDRILLKFKLLDHAQIAALYQALRYFRWRKDDKLYAKVAIQSQLITESDMNRCLKEQKRAFTERRELLRVNEIAFSRGLLSPRNDKAIIAGLKKMKPKLNIPPLPYGDSQTGSQPGTQQGLNSLISQSSSGASQSGLGTQSGSGSGSGFRPGATESQIGRGPAKKGEEEKWRREMRARELAELSSADPLSSDSSIDPTSSSAGLKHGSAADYLDKDQTSSSSGGGRARTGPVTDEDLDPLWAEADLDDVVLDSEQREAARGAKPAPGDNPEDDTDLF